jgi:RNA polymerase sigma-32 factor
MSHAHFSSDRQAFFQAARRAPVLEREQEIALALLWQQGDRHAAEILARSHLRYVIAIARKYRRYGVSDAELIAEGNFGIVQALQKFDPARGVRFMTYAAHWVRSYVIDYVVKTRSLVGGGSAKTFFKLRRERSRLSSLLGEGAVTDALLAERIGVTPQRLRQIAQRLDARDVPLETPASEHSATTLLDLMPAPGNQEQDLHDREARSAMATVVRAALSGLDPRERYIAEHRLMADPAEELSLAEIARRLGVSGERIRQLEARTKQKLRARIPAFGNAAVNEWLVDLVGSGVVTASAA